ncbi:hypothetical protein J6590_080803 [Homalodisca vitripennis]|nr:hypothetical protein J6590_080803 [Homalodisca vitripennis]
MPVTRHVIWRSHASYAVDLRGVSDWQIKVGVGIAPSRRLGRKHQVTQVTSCNALSVVSHGKCGADEQPLVCWSLYVTGVFLGCLNPKFY